MTSEILLIYKGQVLAEGNIYRIREMIDENPHKIRVECDRPRELSRGLVVNAEVRSLEFPDGGPDGDGGGAVVIETHNPDACYPLIPEVALEQGIKIRSLTSPDNNLQAVFEYLTEGRSPEGAATIGTGPGGAA
jgi:ABC-2 type transport system ATP-binding protein